MKHSLSVIALLFALVMSSCGNNPFRRESNPPVKVGVFTVDSLSRASLTRDFVGVVEDSFTTALSFSTGGNIRKIYVREGDVLKRGQLVAELDDKTAKDAFAAAKASYDRAVDGYDRAKTVYDKGSLPEVKWIEVTSSLTQAEALYNVALRNLRDCKLYSAVDGVVASRNAEQGMNVSAYMPVVTVMSIDDLEISIKVPENEISSMEVGQRTRITVPALGEDVFDGRVASKGVIADALSHSYKVRISLGKVPGMMPGMVCRVKFDAKSFPAGTYVVPGRAVRLANDSRRYVWILSGDNTVTRRYVSVIGTDSDGVLIGDGLREGDRIVSDGVAKISEGMTVVTE